MKTANTNFRTDGIVNLSRPITRNIDGIADDISVLRQKSKPAHVLLVFCIFPNSGISLESFARAIKLSPQLY